MYLISILRSAEAVSQQFHFANITNTSTISFLLASYHTDALLEENSFNWEHSQQAPW